MRIAIISFFHPESSVCLAKYLADEGCKVDYYYIATFVNDQKGVSGFEYSKAKRILGNHKLSYEESPEIYDYFDNGNVKVYLTRILHYSRFPKIDKILMYIFMTQIKMKGYDVINIVGQYSYIEIAHKVFKNSNLVHTFHEIGNHTGKLSVIPIVKKAVDGKSKIIMHSKAMYDRLCEYLPVDEKLITTIPFGKFETYKCYDRNVSYPVPFKNDKPILLFVGFLEKYKGLDTLKDAFLLLGDYLDRFNLLIAGNGNDETLDFFKEQKNTYVVNRFLPNDEMIFYIKKSSVILLPYKSASQTGIIPTCSVFGKPYIATKVGAFPEMVAHGVNGLLVEKESPNEFAEAVKSLLDDPQLLQTLSENSYVIGSDNKYDWKNIAKKTIAFFKQA